MGARQRGWTNEGEGRRVIKRVSEGVEERKWQRKEHGEWETMINEGVFTRE